MIPNPAPNGCKNRRQAILVVDLGFGDAGKGSLIDFLARCTGAHTVIRFNGGAQAAHNVITPDGQHHTFSQFGSATFLPGVRTYLSSFMLIEPYAMFNEEQHLRQLGILDAFARTFIDRQALVITPFQRAANRLKELARGHTRHGSCGVGIGETMADFLAQPQQVLFAGDLPQRERVLARLRFLRDLKFSEIEPLLPLVNRYEAAREEAAIFERRDLLEIVADNYAYLAEQVELVDGTALRAILQEPGTVLFEGAQGVLIDEWYGFAPYTTWSSTTFSNAFTLLRQHEYTDPVIRVGVLRTYFTRHGEGPFVTEEPSLADVLPEPHNTNSPWQRTFRRGYFDLVAARYALEVTGGVDQLAVTHLDQLANMPTWKLCSAYCFDGPTSQLDSFFDHHEQVISRIKVHRPPTLEHQEQLAQQLFHCKPVYGFDSGEAGSFDPGACLSLLEQQLGVPVSIMSSGPTAGDKQFRRRDNPIRAV